LIQQVAAIKWAPNRSRFRGWSGSAVGSGTKKFWLPVVACRAYLLVSNISIVAPWSAAPSLRCRGYFAARALGCPAQSAVGELRVAGIIGGHLPAFPEVNCCWRFSPTALFENFYGFVHGGAGGLGNNRAPSMGASARAVPTAANFMVGGIFSSVRGVHAEKSGAVVARRVLDARTQRKVAMIVGLAPRDRSERVCESPTVELVGSSRKLLDNRV